MTKRLLRYSTIQKAIAQETLIKQAGNASSIILKSGKVYTGRILQLDLEKVVFENMRLERREISARALSELIIDIKAG